MKHDEEFRKLLCVLNLQGTHRKNGALRKNVSLVQKSRRTSIERSFFAECPREKE
jgi:hypothetical protein